MRGLLVCCLLLPLVVGCSKASPFNKETFTNSIGMKFVRIPKGTFMMGSPETDSLRYENESPQHEVTISKDFYLGVTEVTQAQYQKVMESNPGSFQKKTKGEAGAILFSHQFSADQPVDQVSWSDAVEFCERLSALPKEKEAGLFYRLPTEAEWEYACRAGSQTAYFFGGNAHSFDEYTWGPMSTQEPWPVGHHRPNAWGFYDMLGNLSEWCEETSDTTPNEHAVRGGNFNTGHVLEDYRLTRRRFANTNTKHGHWGTIGFRVAMSVSDVLPSPDNGPVYELQKEETRTGSGPMIPTESITNSIGMKLVLIPKATFTMGCSHTEPYWEPTESQRYVSINKDYFLGVTEVTQAQFEKVMGWSTMGDHPQVSRLPDRPIDNVTWDTAVEFCKRLSESPEESGRVYRLPTQEEWEYAGRAGSSSPYGFLDDVVSIDDYAWYKVNHRTFALHPVGQKKPNAWGLFDMYGNVDEWCSDWYGDYLDVPVTDPVGADSGKYRVVRGGHAMSSSRDCRSAGRFAGDPISSHETFRGFRIAVTPLATHDTKNSNH